MCRLVFSGGNPVEIRRCPQTGDAFPRVNHATQHKCPDKACNLLGLHVGRCMGCTERLPVDPEERQGIVRIDLPDRYSRRPLSLRRALDAKPVRSQIAPAFVSAAECFHGAPQRKARAGDPGGHNSSFEVICAAVSGMSLQL